MNRVAAILVLLAFAASAAGCGKRYETRTGRATLERAVSRAFKRNYAAAYRMTTGRANRLVIRHADVRCRPRTAQPDDEVGEALEFLLCHGHERMYTSGLPASRSPSTRSGSRSTKASLRASKQPRAPTRVP